MSVQSEVNVTLVDLAKRAADLALLLRAVATCPARWSRLWPAIVRELRAMRPKIDAAIPLIEQEAEGEMP